MELRTRNVNSAFRTLVEEFQTYGKDYAGAPPIVRRTSRNGAVLQIDEPVTVTYDRPLERVLFNATRDANPFSLVYEALWMLAGRNDVAPLAWYTRQFAEYSDDGTTLGGAYGYRWRHVRLDERFGNLCYTDQLVLIVEHLRASPDSRRAVLQMWTVEDDLLKADAGKDLCCNTQVMFAVRQVNTGPGDYGDEFSPALDMTVINRSNDLVWGMLGANYVTFSVLQEYLAARLGVGVGRYHRFTNNLHAYVERQDWKPSAWLADDTDTWYDNQMNSWTSRPVVPLVRDPAAFDRELPGFVDHAWGPSDRMEAAGVAEGLTEPFLANVALPMYLAYAAYKAGYTRAALGHCEWIAADDWKIACTAWLQRRLDRKAARVGSGQWDDPAVVPGDRSGS